jgi:ethanolamine-phosphate cytidylyltransferase
MTESVNVSSAVAMIHGLLEAVGIPKYHHPPTPETLLLSLFVIFVTAVAAHRWKQRDADLDLQRVKAQLANLQQQQQLGSSEPKQVRIFMDGAFDMMHFGHMNAFRLGRELGTHLIVGINSDESITECKGPPLMNNQQRLTMVESCKFVDQVVRECPYIMNKDYLEYIIREFKIDYVIHGDDPCIVDGKDVYATAKAAGKYKSIPRTEGISTTDIVGRVLSMSQNNQSTDNGSNGTPPLLLGQTSRFLTTSHLLTKFSTGNEAPKLGMKVVYIDGDFDMFHCGHVAMLQAAKKVSENTVRKSRFLTCCSSTTLTRRVTIER